MHYVTGIKDVGGVQYCANLREFVSCNSPVDLLEDITYCRKLKSFIYEFTEEKYQQYGKTDFRFLQKLPELKEISITGNKLEDVSVFANFHKVTELTLSRNPVKNISPLKEMQSLDYLEVDYCELSSLEGLDDFKALKELGVAGNLFTEEQAFEYKKRYSNIEFFFED